MATHFLPGDSYDRGAWRAVVHGIAQSQTWLLLTGISSLLFLAHLGHSGLLQSWGSNSSDPGCGFHPEKLQEPPGKLKEYGGCQQHTSYFLQLLCILQLVSCHVQVHSPGTSCSSNPSLTDFLTSLLMDFLILFTTAQPLPLQTLY